MRLKNIILVNRAPFEHLNFKLDYDNVTLFSGINGAGKTTILSYIVDAFYELAQQTFHNEFEGRHGKYYRISSNTSVLKNNIASIVYLRFQMDNDAKIDYVDILNSCTEEEYEQSIPLSDKISFNTLKNLIGKDRSLKYWSIRDSDLIKGIFNSNILTSFPAYRFESPAFLNDPYKIELTFKKDNDYYGYLTNPIEVSSTLENIANWIMDVVLDDLLYRRDDHTITNINSILNEILYPKLHFETRLGIGPRNSGAMRIGIFGQNDHYSVYPSIFSMSSGELSLLCLFAELARQADNIHKLIHDVCGIVVIDEIDMHLHVKLQKEVVPKLITLFPKLQFIISSHSPFLSLGLHETSTISHKIFDLTDGGKECLPENTELFREVYDMMIETNNRFLDYSKELETIISKNNKPLIITEGKTDWKHIKSAMRRLDIHDIDLEFWETQNTCGDTNLAQYLCKSSEKNQNRIIIGIFDRDNTSKLKTSFKELNNLETQEYINLGNHVYCFALPTVNADLYGEHTTIEHYYTRDNLTKNDLNGRRLFLGEEFYPSGISKDRKHFTRCKSFDTKVKYNGIIDDKVYDFAKDPQGENSIALTKNDFAEYVYNEKQFTKGFTFREFNKIFDIIRKIITDDTN